MRREILVLAHSYFPEDTRIRKQVLALLEDGREVDIVCLRGVDQPEHERIGRAEIFRLPVSRHRDAGRFAYAAEYARFFVMAAGKVARLMVSRRYRVVQVHTLPDFLIFAALVPRLLGARLVLDLHEAMPELFATKYRLNGHHPFVRFLKLIERASCRFADKVITVHEPLAEILISRGVPAEKMTIVMNTAQLVSDPTATHRPNSDSGPFELLYHGLVNEMYDLRTAIEAISLLRERGHTDVVLRVVGNGPQLRSLRGLAHRKGLIDQVLFHGEVPPTAIPSFLSRAEAGLIPLANRGYTHLALPTKLLECVAWGVPVIVTERRTIDRYFGKDSLWLVEVENPAAIADSIVELRGNAARRSARASRARERVASLSWDRMGRRYTSLMSKLISEVR